MPNFTLSLILSNPIQNFIKTLKILIYLNFQVSFLESFPFFKQKNKKMLVSPIFYSFYSCFYTDESRFILLSSTFHKNLNLLKRCYSIDMPPFYQIEHFFAFYSKFENSSSSMTMKQFFKTAKVYLIWLFSVYEILTQKKSFDNFVKNFHFAILIFYT